MYFLTKLDENISISIKFPLKEFTEVFFTKGLIDNMPSLVQIMAWRRIGANPLSEAMTARLADAYICVTQHGCFHEITQYFRHPELSWRHHHTSQQSDHFLFRLSVLYTELGCIRCHSDDKDQGRRRCPLLRFALQRQKNDSSWILKGTRQSERSRLLLWQHWR